MTVAHDIDGDRRAGAAALRRAALAKAEIGGGGRLECVVDADRGLPGFSIGGYEHMLGGKGSPTGSPVLEDVHVPNANRLQLADMESRTAAARALLDDACRQADAPELATDLGKWTSMGEVVCSDTAMQVTVEAVQVLGGYGYTTEFPVERMLRDATITQIYEGTNEIQRMVIARHL